MCLQSAKQKASKNAISLLSGTPFIITNDHRGQIIIISNTFTEKSSHISKNALLVALFRQSVATRTAAMSAIHNGMGMGPTSQHKLDPLVEAHSSLLHFPLVCGIALFPAKERCKSTFFAFAFCLISGSSLMKLFIFRTKHPGNYYTLCLKNE